MIKDYITLLISIIVSPFLPMFLPKLNNNILHIAFIKLGGLSKYINDLCRNRPYNLLTVITVKNRRFMIIYVRGVPFYLFRIYGDKYQEILDNILCNINCIYHVHQLSPNIPEDMKFLADKHYIITLHDYYTYCRRFFMLDELFKFCNADGRCCGGSIERNIRQESVSIILELADKIIVPDKSMLVLFKSMENRITVIPHGI